MTALVEASVSSRALRAQSDQKSHSKALGGKVWAAVEKGFARKIVIVCSRYRVWVKLVMKPGSIFFLNPSEKSHLWFSLITFILEPTEEDAAMHVLFQRLRGERVLFKGEAPSLWYCLTFGVNPPRKVRGFVRATRKACTQAAGRRGRRGRHLGWTRQLAQRDGIRNGFRF